VVGRADGTATLASTRPLQPLRSRALHGAPVAARLVDSTLHVLSELGDRSESTSAPSWATAAARSDSSGGRAPFSGATGRSCTRSRPPGIAARADDRGEAAGRVAGDWGCRIRSRSPPSGPSRGEFEASLRPRARRRSWPVSC
jgi:hypothetical protein